MPWSRLPEPPAVTMARDLLWGSTFFGRELDLQMSAAQFLKTTIVLPVSDIYETIAWYERAMKFETRYVYGSGRPGRRRRFC